VKPTTPSLYGVAIFVSDIARATEFYRDTLELPVTKQGSFGLELFEGATHVGIHPAVHPDAREVHVAVTWSSEGREERVTLAGVAIK